MIESGKKKIIRSDKRKNTDKVAASYVKNPLQSQREAAKDTWLSLWNVNDKVDKLEQTWTKDDRIISLTDWDFALMIKIATRKNERMDDKTTPVWDNDLNNWDKEAKARYTLFRGAATDSEGGMKDFTKMSDEELLKYVE